MLTHWTFTTTLQGGFHFTGEEPEAQRCYRASQDYITSDSGSQASEGWAGPLHQAVLLQGRPWLLCQDRAHAAPILPQLGLNKTPVAHVGVTAALSQDIGHHLPQCPLWRAMLVLFWGINKQNDTGVMSPTLYWLLEAVLGLCHAGVQSAQPAGCTCCVRTSP